MGIYIRPSHGRSPPQYGPPGGGVRGFSHPGGKDQPGIPNYGYEWPLPYVRGTTKAQSISNREAVARAIDHGVPIRFDETAWSPYLRYWQYGIQNEIWFEDVAEPSGENLT